MGFLLSRDPLDPVSVSLSHLVVTDHTLTGHINMLSLNVIN